jgi:hypothetical protein
MIRLSVAIATIALMITPMLSAAENEPAENEAADQELIEEIAIDPFDRDHWAYRPIVAPEIPAVAGHPWPRTSIDRFVLAQLEQRSLQPAAAANRQTLIRRLYFDLIGLPPTTAELDAFLSDQRPGAYRRLVDRLLASPDYGRRWGQHWLDLARFAETDGFEHDKVRPNAWKYRDWVIEALNQDLPFDRFVTMQIAGDVLRPDDPDAAVATAFCLSGPDMPDINSQEERKHVLMNEVTSTIGAVFLSLQVGCAQCHDHKYDAISQADFYRLRAFFDSAVKLDRNKSVTTLDRNADPEAESHFYYRGDWRRAGPVVEAAFPRIANRAETAIVGSKPADRRLELARWLIDPSHPLTSRSIVNRIWQHHFGRGLSSTASDFGVMGEEPTHPELLDHLARKLVQRDWSLKELHRQIVLSSVYRTRSRPPVETAMQASWNQATEADPDNRLLARFPRRRLDAETIRDAMLMASDALDGNVGGPSVSPPLPSEMIKTLLKGQWTASPREADHHRRSIYIFARRNLRYPMFATFDRPAANSSCAARHPSTTAVQSLLLLNSKFTLTTAQRMAAVVSRTGADRSAQCVEVYRRLLSRDPNPVELAECIAFLEQQSSMLSDQQRVDADVEAMTDLCRAMINSNQFLYVD